jgi:hypothetical protein
MLQFLIGLSTGDDRHTHLDVPASAHHIERDRAANADIREQPVEHRPVADIGAVGRDSDVTRGWPGA